MKTLTSLGKARLCTVLVGVAAFLLFRATLHEGFFPGESARQAAIAMRLEPGVVFLKTTRLETGAAPSAAGRPRATFGSAPVTTDVVHFRTKLVFWRLASALAAALPLGGLPVSARLNGFCALLGAICAALAFALGRGLTLFLSFHATSLGARGRKRAAACAGLTGAVLLSTAMPFWISSTRCSPYPFEILLLLWMGYALFRAAVGHRTLPLLAFGILFGVSVFEWQVGLFLAPILLFFAFRAMRVGEVGDAYGVTRVLVGFAAGLLGYLLAVHFYLGREGVPFLLAFRELIYSFKYAGGLLFRGGAFESNPLLVSCCLAALPFLAMAAMAIWRDVDSATSSGGLLLFSLACTFSVCALDLPVSPWGASRAMTGVPLPVTSYLFNAAVGAYLAGQGALMARGRFLADAQGKKRGGRRPAAGDDDEDSGGRRGGDSPVGRVLLWYVTAFTVCMACWNGAKIRDWNDSFLDKVAAAAADALGPRTWVITDNRGLGSLLRIHARSLGKRIVVLDPADERAQQLFRNAIDSKADAFKDLPGESIAELRDELSATNAASFVDKWLAIDPAVGSKLEVMGPDEIALAGKKAVPSVLGFHAAENDAEPDWTRLADSRLGLWESLADVPPLGRDAPMWLRSSRAAARQRLADVGRYVADKLARRAETAKAQKVLAAAAAIAEEPAPPTGPDSYNSLY